MQTRMNRPAMQIWANEKATSVQSGAKNAVSLPTGSHGGQSGAERRPTRRFKQVKTNEKGTSIWSECGHSGSSSAQCASQTLKGAQWRQGASLNNELLAAQLLSIMAAFIVMGRKVVYVYVWGCVGEMFLFLCIYTSLGKAVPELFSTVYMLTQQKLSRRRSSLQLV